MGPVRGGEKFGRGRFACEKQAVVHRSGQDRAEWETSRPGVRVGSARKAVVAPGRCGKRTDPAPDLRADERGKLIDRIVDECAVVHERTGERSAEKRLDAVTPKWSQIITTGFRAVGCAEQMAVYRESVRVIKVKHRLFGVAKRQAGGGGNLIRQRWPKSHRFFGDEIGRQRANDRACPDVAS